MDLIDKFVYKHYRTIVARFARIIAACQLKKIVITRLVLLSTESSGPFKRLVAVSVTLRVTRWESVAIPVVA